MTSDAQPATRFVDTHTHLDDEAFETDRGVVITNAISAGVGRMINVGYSPSRWATTAVLHAATGHVSAMYGLHPQHANDWSDTVMSDLVSYLEVADTVAIGEIGLDYFRPFPARDLQQAVFRMQLSVAVDLRLPIVIHQRDAEGDLMTVLSEFATLPPVVLHSFDGTDRLAGYALERGWSIGIGGLATRRSSDTLRRVLASIPVDALLLETDSPYLVPAGRRDRRNDPANIPLIATMLAPTWNVSTEELGEVTTKRAHDVFRFTASTVPMNEPS